MSTKKTLAQRAKTDPALLARALGNAGLRSKLPTSMLTPAQQAQRYANAPAVPGGTLTNGQVAQQSQQAADLQYGPNALALQQQRNKDAAGWYDQYKASLAQYLGNTQAAGDAAVTALGNLQKGVTGLAQADQAAGQQRAEQLRALTGGQAQDMTPTNSAAAGVRQAMLAAIGGQQVAANTANSKYADALANVVAPGQKLQAQMAGQGALRDLGDKINLVKASTTSQLVGGEQKSVAQAAADQERLRQALAIAGLSSQTQIAKTRLTTSTARRGQDISARNAAANRQAAAERQKNTISAASKRQKIQLAANSKNKKPTTGLGSLNQNQENTVRARIDKVYGQLKTGLQPDGSVKAPNGKVLKTDADIITTLEADGLSTEEATAALSLLRHNGKISRAAADQLNNIGVHIGGHYKIVKPSPPTKPLLSTSLNRVGAAIGKAIP